MMELLLALGKSEKKKTSLEVLSSANFITGDSLASLVGLAAGVSMNSTTDWLKITNNETGVVKIIPKLVIRNSISKNVAVAATPVNGSKIVTIQGVNYQVRLMTGCSVAAPPSAGIEGYTGGEFNDFYYAVCNNRPAGWVGDILANFSETELGFYAGNGSATLVNENTSDNRAVLRGGVQGQFMTGITTAQLTSAAATRGWRPILIKV